MQNRIEYLKFLRKFVGEKKAGKKEKILFHKPVKTPIVNWNAIKY